MSKRDIDLLLKTKIDIRAKDDIKFFEISILVDKPKFLDLLPKIRFDLCIRELVGLDGYDEKVASLEEAGYGDFNYEKYENPDDLREFVDNNRSLFGLGDDHYQDRLEQLYTEASLVCYTFKRPPYFCDIVRQAIVCGVVTEKSFHSTSIRVIEKDTLQFNYGFVQLPHVGIMVSPSTTDREIRAAGKIAKQLYKKDKRLNYYLPKIDVANKIRTYREWYWDNLAGLSYADIADKWADRDDEDFTGLDDNRILKGVNYYKKLLNQ